MTGSVALFDRVRAERGTRTERPVDALEITVRYLSWMKTSSFDSQVSHFSRIYAPPIHNGPLVGKDFRDRLLVPSIRQQMNGMTQYVTRDMGRLITDIAEKMPPEMLFPSDMHFPEGGLIVLEEPILPPADGTAVYQEDGTRVYHPGEVKELPLPITAIGYSLLDDDLPIRTATGTMNGGVVITLFCDPASAAKWTELQGEDVSQEALGNAPLVLHDLTVWAFGMPWQAITEESVIDVTRIPPKIAYVRRFLLAYLRLLWQEILDADITPIPRVTRRRLDRVRPQGAQSGDVLSVVRLRKVYEEFDIPEERAGEGSPMLHGYVRRAHWRRIRQGTEDERLVYVRAHVVRPDLPQIDAWQVVSVER